MLCFIMPKAISVEKCSCQRQETDCSSTTSYVLFALAEQCYIPERNRYGILYKDCSLHTVSSVTRMDVVFLSLLCFPYPKLVDVLCLEWNWSARRWECCGQTVDLLQVPLNVEDLNQTVGRCEHFHAQLERSEKITPLQKWAVIRFCLLEKSS